MIRMLPARARSRYGTLVGGPSSRLRAETSHCRQRLLECSRPHLMWSAWDPLAFSWRLRRPFACDEVERLDRHLLDLVRLRRSYAEVRAAVGRHVAVDPRQHLRRRVAGLVAGEHAQPHEADAIRRVVVDIALESRVADALRVQWGRVDSRPGIEGYVYNDS